MGPQVGFHTGFYELPWAISSRSAGGSAYTLWAHARACTRDLTGCRGPTQEDRQVAAHIHCGPMRELAHRISQAAASHLEPIGKWQRIYIVAHARDCTRDLTSFHGPTQADRQVAAQIHCGPTRQSRREAFYVANGPTRGLAHGISWVAVGQLKKIGRWQRIYIVGLREGLHTGSHELPWAITSRFAGGSAYTLWADARDCTRDLTSCRGPT
jgi:hypothetical protein